MDTNKTSKENVGLNTQEALSKLHLEISNILEQNARKAKRLWLRDTFHHQSQHTNINWISAIALITSSFALFISAFYTDDNSIYILESLIIFILLFANITFDLRNNYLRHYEVSARVHHILEKLLSQISRIRWLPEHYPHLCTPFSPCITLQWTYRDNKIVNLPWALLVKEDVILMRPGQICPGYSECLEKNAEYPLLHAKEVYGPALQKAKEVFSVPKARKPLSTKRYKLLETPYANNLRIALEQSLDRPVTQHNQLRHLLLRRVIERALLPLVFIITIFVSILRYIYFNSAMNTSIVDLFIIVPVCTVLPLLPLLFPIAWNVLNYLGMSRFNILLEHTKNVDYRDIDQLEDQDMKVEVFPRIQYEWYKTWTIFLDIFQGKECLLTRTANILHVLGSVTALCCIDKKGILSWPNPTAEKVFFLHNTDNLSESSSLANLGELHTDGDSVKGGTTTDSTHIEESSSAIAEVLDVTYNHADPFKLQFDDPKWMDKHLNSLKPLGLAILLNTCNIETQGQYTEFCSHITCEAMYNENLIPVTNRRCLCELAKEIGFVEKAREIFSLEHNLSTFRHLQPDLARRDHNKYVRSLSLTTRLKHPFPHMFAVIVRELSSGSMQLLSQGTADLVLDSCVDYWDGYDLCPLTSADRKRVLDFYQRGSLTAYCSAFAYRPLSKGVSNKLSEIYLELPSDCRHLYQSHRSPTSVNWDTRSVLEPKLKTALGPFYSTDSLLYNDSPGSDISDTDSCFEMQCNQVFIGMVTMQYQAQADMVHLIEQLERACIRFVHFSKENELRSRVFSEKMGLESGWNCHISLLSDRNSNLASSRTMSFSAPSAINMENTKVRFDNERIERQPLIKTNISNEGPFKSTGNNENDGENEPGTLAEQKTSLESVESNGKDMNLKEHPHDWQSLSCLTDSTEQSAPVNFDMSNRAKLPRGIDKIRPHIELIDNVPLLVSLFTDCTPSGTREMLQIMQDYGEVVCVLGSSANYENVGIFMQADASIAVEPLYPQVCQKRESFQKFASDYFSPIELSRNLNSVPCSLSLKREEPISLIFLVAKARHYISAFWNVVQFWICCCISLSTMQLAASFLMLPSLLSPGQVIWFICVIIPTLSISLIGTRTDYDVMKRPKGKNQLHFNVEILRFVMWCYGTKFMIVIMIVLIIFGSFLALNCFDICNISTCQCLLFYLPIGGTNGTYIDGWSDIDHSTTLFFIQHIVVVLIFVQYVTVSVSFVYRDYNIWNKSPHSNYLWLATIIVLIILQLIFTLSNIQGVNERVPLMLLIFILISPVITFLICEVVKREEIKVNLRYQRRARLDFGTKLGMNSPF